MSIADPDLWRTTSAAASVLLVLLLGLSMRVAILDRHVGPGTPADASGVPLQRARLAQAQCALYAPLALIGIWLLEARLGGPATHWLAALLVFGQLLQALGNSRTQQPSIAGIVGTPVTWAALAGIATALGWQTLTAFV